MSHAERCPVCGGSGELSDFPISTTSAGFKRKCHGCSGSGWVTVPDLEDSFPNFKNSKNKPNHMSKGGELSDKSRCSKLGESPDTADAHLEPSEWSKKILEIIFASTRQTKSVSASVFTVENGERVLGGVDVEVDTMIELFSQEFINLLSRLREKVTTNEDGILLTAGDDNFVVVDSFLELLDRFRKEYETK